MIGGSPLPRRHGCGDGDPRRMPPSAPVAGTWSAARPPPTERLPGSAQRDRTGLGSGRRPIFRTAQAAGRSFSAPMASRIASCDSVGRVAHSRIDFPSPNRTHGPPRRNPAPDPASSAGYFPRTSSGPAIHRPSSAFGEHGPRAPISFIDSTGGEERAAVVDEVEGEAVPKLGYHRLGPSEELRTWIVTGGLGADQIWGAWTWAPYLGEREVDRGTRRLVGSTRTASLTGGDAIPRTGAILFAEVGVRLLRGGGPARYGGTLESANDRVAAAGLSVAGTSVVAAGFAQARADDCRGAPTVARHQDKSAEAARVGIRAKGGCPLSPHPKEWPPTGPSGNPAWAWAAAVLMLLAAAPGVSGLVGIPLGRSPSGSIGPHFEAKVAGVFARANSGQPNAKMDTLSVQTVPLGAEPVQSILDRGNGYVYIVNQRSANVSVLNGSKIVGSIGVGSDPWGATYDSGNGFVYVVNNQANNVSIVNGTSLWASVPVGQFPTSATYDPTNGYVYVTNGIDDTVSVINGSRVIATFVEGDYPFAGVYDAQDGYVYITNEATNNVGVIDGTSLLATLTVGTNPVYPTYDSGNGDVYVPNMGNQSLNVIHGTHVAWMQLGDDSWRAAYDSENGWVYVVHPTSATVSVINGTTNVGTIRLWHGSTPRAIAFDQKAGYLLVANQLGHNVSVLNSTSYLGAVGGGNDSSFVLYDNRTGDVYVTNYGSSGIVGGPRVER